MDRVKAKTTPNISFMNHILTQKTYPYDSQSQVKERKILSHHTKSYQKMTYFGWMIRKSDTDCC